MKLGRTYPQLHPDRPGESRCKINSPVTPTLRELRAEVIELEETLPPAGRERLAQLRAAAPTLTPSWNDVVAKEVLLRRRELLRILAGQAPSPPTRSAGLRPSIHPDTHAPTTTPAVAPASPTNGLWIDEKAMQAKWNGKLLKINAHTQLGVLRMLLQHRGNMVTYRQLVEAVRPGSVSTAVAELEAPPEVKYAVSAIRTAFKAAKCPLRIDNIRRRGWRLSG